MHAQDLPQLKDWLWNWGSWWIFVSKIFCTLRTSKSKLTTKGWNRGATHPVRRSGLIANTSRPSGTGSWRQSSLGRFECYTLLGSKLTSWNFLKIREFMMFFMYYCWSRTPQGKGGWTSSQSQSLSRVTTKGMSWKIFKTVQSMLRKQTDTYQCYTIWLHEKITWKKRTPENLFRRSCTSGRWSALYIKTTRRSR